MISVNTTHHIYKVCCLLTLLSCKIHIIDVVTQEVQLQERNVNEDLFG